MSDFKFEGATGLSEKQLNFISDILVERGFKNNKVIFEAVGKAGDNYVATVKRIIVEKNNGESFKMIAKIAPKIENVRQAMNAIIIFRNEKFMYSKVLPKFLSMQKNARVPENELFRFPEYYGSLMEAPNEIILLEDLQVSNFGMQDRLKPLSSECVKLVLSQFALFHSLSFTLKHEEPEIFLAFSKQLLNLWYLLCQSEEAMTYFDMMEEDLLPILSEEYRAKVKGTLSEMCNMSAKEHKFILESKYAVIQQGDAWTNNMLFNLRKGDKIVECIMIDYQVSKSSSPASDFMYFVFNCTDYESRSKHYNEWIDHYFNEMEKNISIFGLKLDETYTRDQFDTDMKRLGRIGVAQAILLASVTLKESEEAFDMNELENKTLEEVVEKQKVGAMEPATMLRFKDRVDGIVKSFIELGYL